MERLGEVRHLWLFLVHIAAGPTVSQDSEVALPIVLPQYEYTKGAVQPHS